MIPLMESSHIVNEKAIGFEPLQQVQMILQYVETHGRITRREVAELCKLTPIQARYLLQKMVKAGKLNRFGILRGAWYGLSP